MKVVENIPAHIRILSFDKIIIGYSDLNQLVKDLNNVNINLITEHIVNQKHSTISIRPLRQDALITYSSIPENFRRNFKEYKDEKIIIPDFEKSSQLYSILSKNKSGGKIISDSFSFKRGALLYERISHIEEALRSEYVSIFGSNFATSQPDYYVKKSPDHKISQFSLFEMFERELLSPASELFYLDYLGHSSDKRDIIKARQLTKLDELELPFTMNDLTDLRRIRNAVMHFRVVTNEDVGRLFEITQKMDFHSFNNIFKNFNQYSSKVN